MTIFPEVSKKAVQIGVRDVKAELAMLLFNSTHEIGDVFSNLNPIKAGKTTFIPAKERC